jgi:serine/threonine protein kinase
MAIDSVSGLVQTLRDSLLLTPAQKNDLARHLRHCFTDPRALARELLRRDWLTPYQINQVFLGRAAGLALGPYVLLQRLGEGGMGRVYKARHVKMARTVALKVIRKDRLDSPDTTKRFFREVQAAAQLDHPNIVTAYDADEVGGTYFFAMEYIDGQDLGKLVKQDGPLPAPVACDYIHQAAQGLQHAHEKGLVHRDIKPSNLLVAAARPGRRGSGSHPALGAPSTSPLRPMIKILDMGLARVRPLQATEESPTLTHFQAVLGTPDFIAPEQARNAHEADIRSDLYSLGCTFYYLLAGQVPFPQAAPLEKLLKHYLDDPAPVEEVNPEVPPRVGRVVRRLMAKDPDARYQTPAELAEELAALLDHAVLVAAPAAAAIAAPAAVAVAAGVGPAGPIAEDPVAVPEPPSVEEPPQGETLADIDMAFTTADAPIISSLRLRKGRARLTRKQLVPLLVGALFLALTALLLFLLIQFGPG